MLAEKIGAAASSRAVTSLLQNYFKYYRILKTLPSLPELPQPMDDALIHPLLEDLKSPDESRREAASRELWRLWFNQKGAYGLEALEQSQALLQAGRVDQAEAKLNELIQDQPDFAEAWNRRAVLYYMQGRYSQSLTDCQQVVALNPIHFGAIHGMGLCYAALGEYLPAIAAFRRALEVQPHALVNQKMILECTTRLS